MARLVKIFVTFMSSLAALGVASFALGQPGGNVILNDNRYVPPNYTRDQNGFDLKVGFVKGMPFLSIGGASGARCPFQ